MSLDSSSGTSKLRELAWVTKAPVPQLPVCVMGVIADCCGDVSVQYVDVC